MAVKKETKPENPVENKEEEVIEIEETEDDLDILDEDDEDDDDPSWGSLDDAYKDIMNTMKQYFNEKCDYLDVLIARSYPDDPSKKMIPLVDLCSELESFSHDTVKMLGGITRLLQDTNPFNESFSAFESFMNGLYESHFNGVYSDEFNDSDLDRLSKMSNSKIKKQKKKKGKKKSSKSKVKTKTIKVGKNKIKIIKF